MRRLAPRLSRLRWLDVYVGGIVAIGGAVAALAIVMGVPPVPAWQVVLLAVCCAAAQLVRARLPRASSVSPAVVISFAALVWLGPGGAVIVGSCGALVHAVVRRQALSRAAFNAAVWALAAMAGAAVYRVLGGIPPHYSPSIVVAALVAATAYFATNTGLVAGAISLSTGAAFWSVWLENYLGLAPNYALLAIGGGAAAVGAQIGGPQAVVATTTLVLLPWMSIQLYANKARQAALAVPHAGDIGTAS